MSNKTRPDDLAFPRPAFHHEHTGTLHDAQEGVTKREYFAAMALQGLLANPSNNGYTHIESSIKAVRVADFLIYELNNKL